LDDRDVPKKPARKGGDYTFILRKFDLIEIIRPSVSPTATKTSITESGKELSKQRIELSMVHNTCPGLVRGDAGGLVWGSAPVIDGGIVSG
jgi:hypothetical protein